MCRLRELPPAHLASHSLKGCKVTSQKLDSSVYSPNTETALWALLRHPDPRPPQGKRGFQTTTSRLHIPRLLTSRDWPQGGASSLAQQQERVQSDTKTNFVPLKGTSAQRKENLLKYCALLVRILGLPSELPFLPATMRPHGFPAPLPAVSQCYNREIDKCDQGRESQALSQLHHQLTVGTWVKLLCCSGPWSLHL